MIIFYNDGGLNSCHGNSTDQKYTRVYYYIIIITLLSLLPVAGCTTSLSNFLSCLIISRHLLYSLNYVQHDTLIVYTLKSCHVKSILCDNYYYGACN